MSFRRQLDPDCAKRAACLVAVALTLYSVPALADCEEDVVAVTKLASATTDPATHAELITIVKQAEKELWEGDEEECAAKISGAARIAHQTGSPSAGQLGKEATPSSP